MNFLPDLIQAGVIDRTRRGFHLEVQGNMYVEKYVNACTGLKNLILFNFLFFFYYYDYAFFKQLLLMPDGLEI